MSAAILAALVFAGPLGDLSGYPELQQYRHLPRDVRMIMDRRLNCDHWLGEEPYDRDRARQIDAAVRSLKCDRLEADEAGVKGKYAGSPEVLRGLQAVIDASQ